MKNNTTKLIILGHSFSSQYRDGLSNHLPMALYALDCLGANEEKINIFYKNYITRLEPYESSVGEQVRGDIKKYLSRPDLFSSIVEFFKSELRNREANSVVNEYLPLLFQGVSGGAFHPLIRLAFALEVKNNDEIAFALASWVIAYQELQGREDSNTKFNLLESLLSLKELQAFDGYESRGRGVFRRMEDISRHEGFKRFFKSFDVNENSLAEMADICIKLYLSSNDDFTALHAVTSCHAMRVVTEKYENKQELFHYYWHAIGAAYVVTGMPELVNNFDTSNLPSWEKIQSKASESLNDHLIKLVYTCKEEFEFYQNPLYHLAASQKIGLE